jgi:hypothetical protein
MHDNTFPHNLEKAPLSWLNMIPRLNTPVRAHWGAWAKQLHFAPVV